ncbi:MAG: Nucleoside diphosphate kinase [Candidatus Falkowbacteria bacterium GW2011_GWC2_38_22]|uniref:nucleoside-diphosphate kinase n=1 Tax=Candidatus Falkowbacteria bacterium GW2011_GWE1_38_31 TaxID=1618638 RepID=A0A0G0JPP4_9BACT|nr:MAG: Nucleoside diphosphate kinase [Candidatus Falkowbacteria bacterium GW2011_GWF2_38_1205]KKQ60494.1 MAG: Nucleoside diphosphate kinase [Candidatus Falkowbacteria bacterium GW2011_GWC2_38_22]KKQ62592.1 MAG: Nucleoside diphosphate kinase [Candidatus Falkowbacteria bacterium GW2011_GWF1_38_22]KKQ64639.1 MAG: Nucleoside diphosphate kinase [Candidatus Falkowbacteria bacterium GW2011_GWE2_38_254]KKQ69548.1 MAG: Nucleoside diphosphate kinase [Candidatus Falkowbacteria bacterium GW2011_GWE1_38_31
MKTEKTLVIIKPDGVQRSLVGEIIRRYERVGLKLTAMKMTQAGEDMATKHYYEVGGDEWIEEVGRKARAAYEKKGMESPYKTNKDNGWAVLKANAKYLSSGPVVAMVWQGAGAVELVRKITGATAPLLADVGTIRGDFTLDSYALADTDGRSVRNLIHASGTVDEALKEIKIWFGEDEVLKYTHLMEKILYDVNLDGIKE